MDVITVVVRALCNIEVKIDVHYLPTYLTYLQPELELISEWKLANYFAQTPLPNRYTTRVVIGSM